MKTKQMEFGKKMLKMKFQKAVFIDRKELDISDIEASKVYQSFISLGGENGWFDFWFSMGNTRNNW